MGPIALRTKWLCWWPHLISKDNSLSIGQDLWCHLFMLRLFYIFSKAGCVSGHGAVNNSLVTCLLVVCTEDLSELSGE